MSKPLVQDGFDVIWVILSRQGVPAVGWGVEQTSNEDDVLCHDAGGASLWEQDLGQHLGAREAAQHLREGSSGGRQDVSGPRQMAKSSFIYYTYASYSRIKYPDPILRETNKQINN